MRLEMPGAGGADPPDAELKRDIGAVVARATPARGVLLEFGPADGPPLFKLSLSGDEAHRLAVTLQAIASGREEEIVLTEP